MDDTYTPTAPKGYWFFYVKSYGQPPTEIEVHGYYEGEYPEAWAKAKHYLTFAGGHITNLQYKEFIPYEESK